VGRKPQPSSLPAISQVLAEGGFFAFLGRFFPRFFAFLIPRSSRGLFILTPLKRFDFGLDQLEVGVKLALDCMFQDLRKLGQIVVRFADRGAELNPAASILGTEILNALDAEIEFPKLLQQVFDLLINPAVTLNGSDDQTSA
jgi:hypothetical protein